MGNNENHSTANDSSPKTSRLVSSLEANNTDAKIAALVDNDPGILIKKVSLNEYRKRKVLQTISYFILLACVV